MLRTIRLLLCLALITWAVFAGFSVHSLAAAPAANRPSDKGQAVIVVIDRITWDDFLKTDLPAMKRLALQGVMGLMTTNPAGSKPRIPGNTYTTIGAGAKVAGGPSAASGLNASEPNENGTAGDSYYSYTGLRPNGSQVLHLGIAEMEKDNQSLKYQYSLGAIGTLLHQNGLKTAVVGNADIPGVALPEGKYYRQAVTIAMDNRGLVDYGDVSAKNEVFDSRSLAGVKTDFRYLSEQYDALKSKADLVVFETGDTSRINDTAGVAVNEVLQSHRQMALIAVDNFLGTLQGKMDLRRDLLMIVVPEPPTQVMEKGKFLTPFIMAGRGVEKGVVWSGTIKRNGLISNTDIAATIAKYFELPPVVKGEGGKKDVILGGQDIESRAAARPFSDVTKLSDDTSFLYSARYPMVKGYINTVLVLVIAGILALVLKWPGARHMVPLLIAITAVPGIMLWANYIPHPSITVIILEVIGLTFLVTAAAMTLGRGRPLNPFIITTGLTALIIVADIFLGAPLAKTSPLSYDVMSGARFYGIGNEYMGVLIGCVIVFVGLVFDSGKFGNIFIKTCTVPTFALVIYTIATPNLGTNVGGTIAAVAGLGATGVLMFGWSLNRRSFLVISASIAAVLACFIVYDLTRAVEAQSHIGRTVTLIRENGISEIINIIVRKWEVNFKLIKSTSWSWLYFISLLSLPFFNRLFPRTTGRFRADYPWFNKFLAGVGFGSVFALIFNDSGVVAAAMMIIYAIAPYLSGLISVREETEGRL